MKGKNFKALSAIILIALLVSLTATLTACKPQNKIVGTWGLEKINLPPSGWSTANGTILDYKTYSFSEDGNGKAGGKVGFYWSYDKKNKTWRVAVKEDWLNEDGYFETVTISGKTMTFADIYTLKKR